MYKLIGWGLLTALVYYTFQMVNKTSSLAVSKNHYRMQDHHRSLAQSVSLKDTSIMATSLGSVPKEQVTSPWDLHQEMEQELESFLISYEGFEGEKKYQKYMAETERFSQKLSQFIQEQKKTYQLVNKKIQWLDKKKYLEVGKEASLEWKKHQKKLTKIFGSIYPEVMTFLQDFHRVNWHRLDEAHITGVGTFDGTYFFSDDSADHPPVRQ